MAATRIKIQTLILKVTQTRETEASCDDCAQFAAHLVEVLLLNGDAPEPPLEAILHHLQECIPCAEEFRTLQECARMEMESAWPTFEEMWQRLNGAEVRTVGDESLNV